MHYILQDENALYYECGFSCDHALYLHCGSEAYFITDGRYTVEAEALVQGAEVITSADLIKSAARLLVRHKTKKLRYDPKEWRVAAYERLASLVKTDLVPAPDLSHHKRILKRPDELDLLRRAAKLGRQAFKRLARQIDREGFGADEIALTYQAKGILSDFGRYDLSFDPIVAIGPNAAKPHALPTQRSLNQGDLLLVDAGLKYRRYCSDRTRTVQADPTFGFTRSQSFASRKIQRAYDTVRKAHDRAITKARIGMQARRVDALAREVIDKAGFGSYFVHSTGHGVGLDIHEMPYISAKSKVTIEEGMVFTIEPGIYLPGEFGIRIEDMVAMVSGRAEVL
jgi:Xaa-Pro aminopeptidase